MPADAVQPIAPRYISYAVLMPAVVLAIVGVLATITMHIPRGDSLVVGITGFVFFATPIYARLRYGRRAFELFMGISKPTPEEAARVKEALMQRPGQPSIMEMTLMVTASCAAWALLAYGVYRLAFI